MASHGDQVVPSNSGTSVLDLLAALEEALGRDVVAAAFKKLPDGVRERFEQITPLTWVPVAALGVAIDQIAREANVDATAMLDAATRRATERTIKTVWRLMLRLTSDEALLARTPLYYAKSRNVGRLAGRVVAPGRAELVLSEWPGVSARHARALGISIETVVKLAGRKGVTMAWEPTRDGAHYRLTWEL